MKQQTPKIPPKEYADFVKGVDVLDIRFESGEFKDNGFDFASAGDKIKVKVSRRAELLEKRQFYFRVRDKLSFAVVDPNSRKHLIDIKASVLVEYSSNQEISEEIFGVFREVNVPVNTWPYFREFVHNCLVRMGYPRLVLPAWHTVR